MTCDHKLVHVSCTSTVGAAANGNEWRALWLRPTAADRRVRERKRSAASNMKLRHSFFDGRDGSRRRLCCRLKPKFHLARHVTSRHDTSNASCRVETWRVEPSGIWALVSQPPTHCDAQLYERRHKARLNGVGDATPVASATDIRPIYCGRSQLNDWSKNRHSNCTITKTIDCLSEI